jgi:flagellar motor switch protein FliM
MSGRVTNSLSKERINQLLVAARSAPKEEAADVEATDYNWHEPHYFNNVQLTKLDDFLKRVALALAKRFSGFCRSEFDVTIASTTQHFAGEFLKPHTDGKSRDYYLAFGADPKQPCGVLGIPEETAVIWARQLLGDAESTKGSGKSLSQLEESLLLDLTSALVEALCAAYSVGDMYPAESMIQGLWPLDLNSVEELCKVSFSVRKTGSEDGSEAYFVMLSGTLEPAVGKSEENPDRFSANDTSKAILNHLQAAPVTVTIRLASTSLTFEQVMSLRTDDVLLLDRRVDELVELIVDGRTMYYGWLAKSGDKYAVAIAPAPATDGTEI